MSDFQLSLLNVPVFCITLYPFQFCNHLDEDERTGCFALSVLQMDCDCYCSLTLPHGAMGWSAVCDCGIS